MYKTVEFAYQCCILFKMKVLAENCPYLGDPLQILDHAPQGTPSGYDHVATDADQSTALCVPERAEDRGGPQHCSTNTQPSSTLQLREKGRYTP